MKLKNDRTGDVLEVPPPNELGESVVILNRKVVEWVLYSDVGEGLITTGSGREFPHGEGFAEYLVDRLQTNAWAKP